MSLERLTIPRQSVGLLGGIQPDRLHGQVLRADDDRLLARFIAVSSVPVSLKRPTAWSDDAPINAVLTRLVGLQMPSGEEGEPRPWFIPFTEDACAFMDEWRRVVRGWEAESERLIVSVIGKLPGLAARLALVLALLD